MPRLQIQLEQNARTSEIRIGAGLRRGLGTLIQTTSNLEPRKIGLISNKRVYALYGRDTSRSLKAEGFKVHEWMMLEGERFKSFRTLEKAVDFLARNSFERNDVIVALGGGVVGDLAGLTAAVYLRGIPLVQVPTTLLAQIDSSVGGKTAVNLPSGKNLVGAFHQPVLVVIDVETLNSLPRRELVAGFCEMVKQALVSDPALFSKTVHFLKRKSEGVSTPELEELIAAHCNFKASIVSGDEREDIKRLDQKSRKVLNLGHTSAHALEAITNYRWFRHGEAVGYGLLVAGELSKDLGLLDQEDLEAIREAVHLCGPLPPADKLDIGKILRLLKHDKKSVAGELNWVLLSGIGKPKIVSGREIDQGLVRRSLRNVLREASRKKENLH